MINTSDAIFGGGICCSAASPEIINCTFNGNDGDYGGGICCFAFSAPHILNCIVQGTVAGAGIFSSSSPGITINYCDFHNNQNVNFTGTLPPGIGVLNGVNANGDSCDTYHNIYLNPLLVNPPGGNFQLLAASPCIDAGDPASPLDPDGTIADIGAFYFDQSVQVTVSMTAVSPPIILPPTGGSFDYNASIFNGEAAPQTFSVWIMVQLPNGIWWGPALGPVNLTLPPNFTLTRTRTQSVPASAPAGNYLYEGRVGTYPNTIWDSDNFSFIKLSVGSGADPVPDWQSSGQSFDVGAAAQAAGAPTIFALCNAWPNPFNPTTTLSFELRAASFVNLGVYNVSGRLVETLVDGFRDAGSYDVSWDAAGLPSGIYCARLVAGSSGAVQKIVLMK